MYLPPFLVLRANGDFEPYRPYIQAVLDNAWSRTAEMPPYRLLELRFFADHLDLRHRMPSAKTLAGRTVLMNAPSPALIGEAECYALAHAILYLTDLGRASAQAGGTSLAAYIGGLLSTLVGVNVIDGNFDLVSELLLAAGCLHLEGSYEIDAAWLELNRAQWADGCITPRRQVRVEDLVRAPSGRALFHATTVFAMACAAWVGG